MYYLWWICISLVLNEINVRGGICCYCRLLFCGTVALIVVFILVVWVIYCLFSLICDHSVAFFGGTWSCSSLWVCCLCYLSACLIDIVCFIDGYVVGVSYCAVVRCFIDFALFDLGSLKCWLGCCFDSLVLFGYFGTVAVYLLPLYFVFTLTMLVLWFILWILRF